MTQDFQNIYGNTHVFDCLLCTSQCLLALCLQTLREPAENLFVRVYRTFSVIAQGCIGSFWPFAAARFLLLLLHCVRGWRSAFWLVISNVGCASRFSMLRMAQKNVNLAYANSFVFINIRANQVDLFSLPSVTRLEHSYCAQPVFQCSRRHRNNA